MLLYKVLSPTPHPGPYLFCLLNFSCAVSKTYTEYNGIMNSCVPTINLRNKMLPVPLTSLVLSLHLDMVFLSQLVFLTIFYYAA